MRRIVITALRKVIAEDLTEQQLGTRLRQLDEQYGFYEPSAQSYLQKIYLESFAKGKATVESDVFTNVTAITSKDIQDRFQDYPKVRDGDWDFIERMANGEQAAIDEIMKKSGEPGFKNDFDYDLYERYYIDGSRHLEESGIEITEDVDSEKVYFVSSMAYADGVGDRIWALGTQTIQGMADELMDKQK